MADQETSGLGDAVALAAQESGLAVISTLRADGSIQTSLVNVALMNHPTLGGQILAFVTYGRVKLANLRARTQITVTFRSGWQWAAVEGNAVLLGPDDPYPGFDDDRVRLLLREIFSAAGGTHDDWDAYDREMAAQRRTAVLIRPTRVYSNAR